MWDIADKTVLITGATDGLGRALAVALAERGTRLLVHGRDPAMGEALVAELARHGVSARLYLADFAALDSVRAMADAVLAQEARLDVLVNNAGVMTTERQVSRDGHELAFQVNYLAHYLLTHRLLPLLERSAPARVVNVSSGGQRPIDFGDVMVERGWDRARSYCQSKLAQILMTADMAPGLTPRGITINAVHPATFMPTNMVVGRFPPASSIDDGVDSLMHLVADPALDGTTGRYFNRRQEARPDAQAEDSGARAKLRALSEALSGA